MSVYIEYVHARPEFDEVLFQMSQANHFTAADLESNRRGRVGLDQLHYHLKDALMGPLLVLGGGLMISFLVRVAYAGYVEKQSLFSHIGNLLGYLVQFRFDKVHETFLLSGGERLPIIVAAFVITAPAIAWKKLRHIPFRMIFDLVAGRVKRREGPVVAMSEDVKAPGRAGKKGETIRNYYYDVGGEKITVCETGHAALAIGLRYRVYYLATSKALLSIEPIIG